MGIWERDRKTLGAPCRRIPFAITRTDHGGCLAHWVILQYQLNPLLKESDATEHVGLRHQEQASYLMTPNAAMKGGGIDYHGFHAKMIGLLTVIRNRIFSILKNLHILHPWVGKGVRTPLDGGHYQGIRLARAPESEDPPETVENIEAVIG